MGFLDFFNRRLETREADSYTDALVELLQQSASGEAPAAKTSALAALEACAGVTGRAFASVSVEDAPTAILDVLTPTTMNLIGRSLIRHGQLVLYIEVSDGEVVLTPSNATTVTGGYDRKTWDYELSLAGPSETTGLKRVTGDSVLHFQYAYDTSTPWQGLSPLEIASLSGRLSAEIVKALGDEMSMQAGALLTTPLDGQDPSLRKLRADLKKIGGQNALAESGDWNKAGASGKTWERIRTGGSPPEVVAKLWSEATKEIYAACGVNAAVLQDTQGTAGREAYRQFLFGAVAPMGKMIQEELRRKLDSPNLALTWDELRAADISGRARAFQSMVGGGMEVDKAAALSGLLVD